MSPNPGHLPPEAIGKRVRVILRGDRPGDAPHEWPADGRFGCTWSKAGHPADIEQYEVVQ